MRVSDVEQDWSQDGSFEDADGIRVRCYDDVSVIAEVSSEPDSRGSVIRVPAGSVGTVLFYSTGDPCFVELEYELPGAIFGIVEASRTRQAIRNEQKYPR